MTHAKSPQAYLDIERVLDTLIRHDEWPFTLPCHTEKAAIRWLARANSFRSVLRELEEERLGLPKGEGTCKYDHLKLSRKDTLILIQPVSLDFLMIGGEPVEPISDREIEQEFSQDDEH